MKKLLSIFLTLLLVVAMAGCNSNDKQEADSTESTNGKIGIVLNSFDSTMATMKTLFEEAITAQGLEYVTLNSNGDVATELNNVESVISQGVKAIIIMGCDGDGSAAAVKKASEAGIPVIICGRRINADESDYYVYLAGNHEEAGKAQAEYVNSYLEENPDKELYVCYIQGASGNTAVAGRYQGFYDNALEGPYKDRIHVLVDLYGEYDATKANSIASDALAANPDLNCFITMSDDMASGIVSAIQSAGKNPSDYIILSIDLSDVGKSMLDEGTITGTVMMNMKSMADQAGVFAKEASEGVENANKSVTVEGYYQMAFADNYKEMLKEAGME